LRTATPELIAAYEKALCVVFGTPEMVLRIGEHNEDLDELLEVEGVTTAAYITAANRTASLRPPGRMRSPTRRSWNC
jgi:hypothetical protein